MLIAKQKRHENIAEYLLYMWQVEDLLRAANLDIDVVDRNVVSRFNVDEHTRTEIREWYDSLLQMMLHEHLRESGHLQINKNTLIRLTDLHLQLLHDADRFPDYGADYYRTLPFIVELRAKMPESDRNSIGELETCFNALYGVLMLRLQGREVTPQTATATAQISHFLGLLAAYFKRDEEQPLFDNNDTILP